MALKQKITKAQFDALSEILKAEYIADGEGYKLDVEGAEDTGELRRAKDREKQLRKDAETRVNDLQAQLDAVEGTDAKKRGDIAVLEKSWIKKNEDIKTEYEAKLNKRDGYIKTTLVDNVALQIANKITKSPALLLPHIRARLLADMDGDTPVTRVLDKEGKPSATTVDELAKEFSDNTDFAAIITVSQANGGAGKLVHKPGGGASNPNDKPADFSKMSPAEMVEHIKNTRQA